MTVVLVCVRLLFLLRLLFFNFFFICRDGVVWLRYTLSVMPNKAGGNATKFIKRSSGCFTRHACVCVSIHMVVSILLVLCKRNPQQVLY